MSLIKNKVLITRLCCIGDIILSIPMIKTIKKSEPTSEITLVTTNWCKQIVDMIPEIDNVIMFDAPYQKINIFKKLYHVFVLWIIFINGNYDIGINLHRSKFFAVLFFFSRINIRIGFGDSWFLTKKIKYNNNIHESKKFLSLLQPFQYKELVQFPKIIPNLDNIKTVQKILLDNGIKQGDILISLFVDGGKNPGQTMEIRQLNVKIYIQFIKNILDKNNNIRVALINSKEKNEKILEIHKTVNDNRVVLLSNLSLKQVAALSSLSQTVIGGDTGILHLASATGTPVIMFYGPSDPNQWAPMEQKHKIIFHKIDCNPCYTSKSVQDKSNFNGNTFLCKQKNVLCMDMITAEEIENKLQEIINIDE
jgi:heptosyltransferase-2